MDETHGSDETLPRTVASEAASGHPNFPVRNWDRYQVRGFLGAGGMGSVYRAHDPLLNRDVALKFIQASSPQAAARFHQEARTQASVDHPHLVKIYEVGEVEGKPYIAMQLIDGITLGDAAPQMSNEAKAAAIADVADALQATHQLGLIHRDIKPGNILVEKGEDGSWRPYLMDFGLARDEVSAGTTVTGTVVGTPAYMSPEQAEGRSNLDRRADVYSLGAALYALLSGGPPFRGHSIVEVLEKVRHDVPVSLRQTNPSVPADLESVAMKCLRKDPDERYPSAREMGDDLRRFLGGHPVQARPTTPWYRAKMFVRRHRVASATTIIAAAIVVSILAWSIANRIDARRRTEVAQAFGQQIERIDSSARISAMAPLHDVRGERAQIQVRMDEIEARMEELGEIAEGPGHFALGRGALTLGDYASAEVSLDHAWETGYRTPEVAYARGLVLGERYRAGLEAASRLTDEAERDRLRSEVERQYRDPALEMLRVGAEAQPDHPKYVEALLAFYDDQHDDALHLAQEAINAAPWFFEGHLLRGDVFGAMAQRASEAGQYDEARARFEASREAYAAALEVAPSHIEAYSSLARLELAEIRMEQHGPGGDIRDAFARGQSVVDTGQTGDPESASLHLVEARLQYRRANFALRSGEDPSRFFENAIRSAEAATQSATTVAAAFRVLGDTQRTLADHLKDHGEDPGPRFAAAIAAYDEAAAREPNSGSHLGLGLFYKSVAKWRKGRGEDPVAALNRSASSFAAVLAQTPDHLGALQNLGTVHYTLARHEIDHGRDPASSLREAGRFFDQALALDPTRLAVLYNAGRAQRALGLHQMKSGDDPTPAFRKSIRLLETAIEAHPTSVYLPYLWDAVGKAHTGVARHAILADESPERALAAGERAFGAALEARPGELNALNNLMNLKVVRARFELSSGEDPAQTVAEVLTTGRQILGSNGNHVGALGNQGAALAVLAEWQRVTGTTDLRTIASAREALSTAVDLNPQFAPLLVMLGQVHLLDGLARSSTPEACAASFERSRTALGRAHELDPTDSETCLALARHSYYLLEANVPFVDKAQAVAAGLRWAEEALTRQPGAPEAEWLWAAIRLRPESPALPREEAASERSKLVDLFEDHSDLARRYGVASH